MTLKVTDNRNAVAVKSMQFNITSPAISINQTVSGVRPNNYYYTLAFEDNLPPVSDYDYNDFVSDLNISRILNSNNQITKIIISAKALAKCAGYVHKFKIKLKVKGTIDVSVKEIRADNSTVPSSYSTSRYTRQQQLRLLNNYLKNQHLNKIFPPKNG